MPTIEINGHDVEVDDSFLKMSSAQQNAAVDEIGKSLPSHPSKSGTMDFLSSIPRGIVQGAAGAASAMGQAEAPNSFMPPEQIAAIPNTEQGTRLIEQNLTGDLPRPEGGPGRYGETVGEFLGNPSSWVGPGGPAVKAVSAVGGAVGSEAGRNLAQGSGPWGERAGALIGALIGGRAAPRAVTPLPLSPERAAIVDALRQEGVTGMSAGTRTGFRPLKYGEEHLSEMIGGGAGAEEAQRTSLGQYTRAALHRVGENADRATPEVIDRSFNRIGGEFDRLTAANTMHLDQGVQNDMLNTVVNYQGNVAPLMRSPFPENVMNDVATWAGQQGGQLTGRQYQNLRSRLSAASRGNTDPQLSHALSDLTEHLDDAMERSIAVANPRDAGAFGEARRQYRNMLVLERAAAAGGERAAEGFITPAQLRTAVKAVEGTRAYARGHGDFSGLAHSGNASMLPLPQSGTAPRQSIAHAIEHLGLAALLGGEAAHQGASMPEMLGIGAAGAVAPALVGRALMSRPVQSWAGNQVMPGNVSPYANAIRALTSGNQGQSP